MPPFVVPAEAVIRLDPRVLIFTAALSLVCGIGFGLSLALGTTRTTFTNALVARPGANTSPAHRQFRNALIVAEVALTFVLLTGAGLLIRSFFNMRQADTGFDATNVLTAEMPIAEHRFGSPEQLQAFMRQIVENVQALPGVRHVAFTDGMPLHGSPTMRFFQIGGRPIVDRAQRPAADLRVVTPNTFERSACDCCEGAR